MFLGLNSGQLWVIKNSVVSRCPLFAGKNVKYIDIGNRKSARYSGVIIMEVFLQRSTHTQIYISSFIYKSILH